jgi:hypothetical protein
MTSIKTLTIVAALLAGGTSLALAQNGPATGGEPSVAGGANGNPAVPGPGYSGYYLGAPGYFGAPGYATQGYIAQPGYAVAPGYVAQPGYLEESGNAPAPGRVAATRHKTIYNYGHRTAGATQPK